MPQIFTIFAFRINNRTQLKRPKIVKFKFLSIIAFAGAAAYCTMAQQNNIAEEVAWIVGDEPIYKSQIEEQYSQLQYEKTPINGDPYCVIPEQLAIDKLFLHQAVIDTVTVEDATVAKEVNARINYFVESLGSKEKVEEYFRKSIPEIREQYMEIMKNQYIVQQVKENLTKNVKSTPADVRKYYESLDKDSIPYVPMQVEAQIITIKPIIPQEEIDEVKSRLRDYAQRVNNGESEFSTLAILYSQDGSSVRGGEIGFRGRTELMPEYASVAFNLTDPKKASRKSVGQRTYRRHHPPRLTASRHQRKEIHIRAGRTICVTRQGYTKQPRHHVQPDDAFNKIPDEPAAPGSGKACRQAASGRNLRTIQKPPRRPQSHTQRRL